MKVETFVSGVPVIYIGEEMLFVEPKTLLGILGQAQDYADWKCVEVIVNFTADELQEFVECLKNDVGWNQDEIDELYELRECLKKFIWFMQNKVGMLRFIKLRQEELKIE